MTSCIRWLADADKILSQSLLLFYVYMFGDIADSINIAAARASIRSPVKPGEPKTPELNRGQRAQGESFGIGDSRAAFDLKGFMARRRQMGTSEELIKFLEAFVHSQMFERFCADRVAMHHSRNQSPTKGHEHSHMTDYEKVCKELSLQHLSHTVFNIRHVIDQINKRRAKADSSKEGSKDGEQFHPLALVLTSNSSTGGDGSEITGRTRADMEHVCADAAKDGASMTLVCRTIWLRLEDCKMFNWKHGLRGLQLLHMLLLHGPHGVLSDALDHLPLIASLRDYGSQYSSTAPAESRELIRNKAHEVVRLLVDHNLLAMQRRWIGLSRVGAFPFFRLQAKIMDQRKKDAAAIKDRGFNPQSPNQIPSFKNLHLISRPPVVVPAAPVLIPSTHDGPSRRLVTEGAAQLTSMLLDFQENYGSDDPASSSRSPLSTESLVFTNFFDDTPVASSEEEKSSATVPVEQAAGSTSGDFGSSSDGFGLDPFGSVPDDSSPSVIPASDPFFGGSAWPATEGKSVPAADEWGGVFGGSDPFAASGGSLFQTSANSTTLKQAAASDVFASDPFGPAFGAAIPTTNSTPVRQQVQSDFNADPFGESFGGSVPPGPFQAPTVTGGFGPDPFASTLGPATASANGGSTQEGFGVDPFASSGLNVLSLSSPVAGSVRSMPPSQQFGAFGGTGSVDPFAELGGGLPPNSSGYSGYPSQQLVQSGIPFGSSYRAPQAPMNTMGGGWGLQGMQHGMPMGGQQTITGQGQMAGQGKQGLDQSARAAADPFANILQSGNWKKK